MAKPFFKEIWTSLGGEDDTDFQVTSPGSLPSVFPVTSLATSSIAAAALAGSELAAASRKERPNVVVDRRLASLWFGLSIRPIGWQLPPPWDAFSGDYRTRDGWIRIHANAPHHRAAHAEK